MTYIQYLRNQIKRHEKKEEMFFPNYNVMHPPTPMKAKELLRLAGVGVLRGVGFTRKDKDEPKKIRKMRQASRRRNRRK